MGAQQEQAIKISNKLKSREQVKAHNVKTLKRKLNELKGEIGLTNDDITIIVFTSLDHD